MSETTGILLPSIGQYAPGYPLPSASTTSKGAGSSATSSTPSSVVSIRTAQISGTISAAAGDVLAVSDLYSATAPTGGSIAGYQVALRSDQDAPNDGTLELNGVDVTNQISFTPDQFTQLHYIAGPTGSSQDLLVVAQSGSASASGVVSSVTDSTAVQITANIAGTRSVNAAGALLTTPTGDDVNFLSVAQQASIFTGFGATAAQPTLTTVGNVTVAASDTLSLASLYSATPPSGGTIAGYQVAIRGGGSLTLNGVDVTDQTSFTADQFAQLHFIAGASGSSQDLVVAAQTGSLNSAGVLTGITDSPAVSITADATGTRSVNVAGALLTTPTGDDAHFLSVAQQASIFTGFGATAAQPTLTTVGNVTVAASDTLSLASLYSATPPSGGTIAGYQVAIRGGGSLTLNGVDVTDQTSFTADQFAQLHFVAGASGSSQDLVVVAQTGTLNSAGVLTGITDSPAVSITADATGTRSVNVASALLTTPTGDDVNFLSVAQQASIFTGFGATAAQPTLSTVGNVTVAASDTLSLASLYSATPPSGGTIAGYQVAIRGGGSLQLNGVDVTDQTSFTADQFAQLHFVAGASGSSQDLVVAAQTGTLNGAGVLTSITDSPAVSITADATGTRSVNVAGALLTTPTGDDAHFLSVAQQASIFTGFGATSQPTLSTVGNVTVAASDTLSLASLYSATPPSGGTIAGYQVAIRGGGSLQLNGIDVTDQTSFTADQFAQLHFVAGDSGSSQDLVVVAQTGSLNSAGVLTGITDSPAVSITADATGTRSVNAAGALLTTPTGGDANFLSVAQQASIFTGFGATSQRPSLTAVGTQASPTIAADQLAGQTGAYQTSNTVAAAKAATALSVLSLYADAVGGSQTTAKPSAASASPLPLDNADIGGLQIGGGNLALQLLAVAAYQASQRTG